MNARGFTLIELMGALVVGSILGASFFAVMYAQQVLYYQRLEEIDAHQNARAALNLLERYTMQARLGFGANPLAAGTVPVGRCYSDSNSVLSQGNCNGIDGGADRMRITFLNPDTEFSGNAPNASSGACPTSGAQVDGSRISVNVNPVIPFAANTLMGVGGSCLNPTPSVAAGGDLFTLSGDTGYDSYGCLHRYGFSLLEGGTSLTCSSGYAPNFGFGRAIVADFFIQTTAGQPNLMLRTDPRTTLAKAFVVAYGVEDFQVSYGIDLGATPDRAVDLWCDDPRTSADGGAGACAAARDSSNVSLTTAQVYSRIIAVQLILRVRSAMSRPQNQPALLEPNAILANPVANVNDGYRRWIYRATVALRNNNL